MRLYFYTHVLPSPVFEYETLRLDARPGSSWWACMLPVWSVGFPMPPMPLGTATPREPRCVVAVDADGCMP